MEHQQLATFRAGKHGFLVISAAIVAFLALLAQLQIYDRTAVAMDEGHLAAAASRILDGEVLYRDIHTGIGPGIYYATAALLGVFGSDLLVTRQAQIAVNLVIAVCLWLLAVRVVRLHWAALAPALYLLLLAAGFPVLTMLNYSSLSLAGALAALLWSQRYLASGRRRDGVILGLLLAATALTKQNFGALALLAIGTSLLWNRSRSAFADRGALSMLLPVAAAGAALALLTVGYFASSGAFLALVRATLIDIGGPQLASFNNPIPPLLGPHPRDEPRFVFLYTPPALFNHLMHGGKLFGASISPFLGELAIRLSYGIPIASLVAAPLALHFGRSGTALLRGEARATALFAAVFFLGIFPSAIWSHLAFVVPPALLALVICLDRLEARLVPADGTAAKAAAVVALALAVGCGAASLRIGSEVRGWYPRPLDLSRARVFVTENQRGLYRGAVDFVERCTAEEEAIFVAPDIPLVYFLSARPNATRYDLTIPGNVDGSAIVERLETLGVRCVVYNPRMYPEFPPFEELFPALSRYLESAYRRDEVITGVGMEWHGLVRREALRR